MKIYSRIYVMAIIALSVASTILAQPQRQIHTVLSFLNLAPDARAAALGEGGVASTPDAFSPYWNVAKMPFGKARAIAGFSYVPWLPSIVNDMYLGHAVGQYDVDSLQTLAFSFSYFDYGDFEINNDIGQYVEDFNSYETSIALSYARKLSSRLGIGVTAKYIRSDLPGKFELLEDLQIGKTWALDFGIFYKNQIALFEHPSALSLGLQLSNVGPKISYDHGLNHSFLPATIRLGAALKTAVAEDHVLEIILGFAKLMVPTPPIYEVNGHDLIIVDGKDPDRSLLAGIFGSFSDAPEGLREELREVGISSGLEYGFRNRFLLRAGYHYEHRQKSDLSFLTTGIGLKYKDVNIDFSYLVSTRRNHPLSNTLRLSIAYLFN